MKKNVGLYLCMLLFAFAIACGGVILNAGLKEKNRTTQASQTSGSNRTLRLSDVPVLMDEGYTGILYIGFPSCPYCKEVKPIVYGIKEEYNCNFKYIKLRDKNNNKLFSDKDKKNVYKYFSEYMDKNNDGTYTIYAPLVVVVKKGKVIDAHLSTVDGHDAHIASMTEEQKEEFITIIRTLFDEVSK